MLKTYNDKNSISSRRLLTQTTNTKFKNEYKLRF